MKCENNDNYQHKQLIAADYHAYYMAGSSPCEDCDEMPSNLYFLCLCQEKCEEYCKWADVYRKYFNEYLDKSNK